MIRRIRKMLRLHAEPGVRLPGPSLAVGIFFGESVGRVELHAGLVGKDEHPPPRCLQIRFRRFAVACAGQRVVVVVAVCMLQLRAAEILPECFRL